MPSAKVTGMTFTSSNQMFGWRVEPKTKERTAGNLLAVIKYSVGKVRAQVRVTAESKMLTLGKSSEWLEWTQRITQQTGKLS